jgi:hypothetical protein
MYRISSTIDFKDVVLMREVAIGRNPIFHEIPPSTSSETICSEGESPTLKRLDQNWLKVRLAWLLLTSDGLWTIAGPSSARCL